MRLTTSLAFAALSGVAVNAAEEAAEVFLFTANSQNAAQVPQLPKEIARNIFLQRTATSSHGTSLSDIPSSITEENALQYIDEYGTSTPSLFGEVSSAPPPAQIVVLLEGITHASASALKGTFSQWDKLPAFTIADPPSAAANDRLLSYFRATGISKTPACGVSSALDPFDQNCWTGTSSFVKYDAQQNPEVIPALLGSLANLDLFVSSGHLEVALVLLPESSRTSTLSSWASSAKVEEQHMSSELRRRDFGTERVMTDATFSPAATDASPVQSAADFAATSTAPKTPKTVPACFSSADKCTAGTNSCSGHGSCVNKYGSDSGIECYVCACKETVEDKKGAVGRRVTHWGGATCAKEDVSVQFWLLASIAVLLAGAVAFAIGLLFSVGEEELPGVIGAGVSRSSK